MYSEKVKTLFSLEVILKMLGAGIPQGQAFFRQKEPEFTAS
ncbi:MAG TPA: hypothetical protein VFV48_05820 [Pseudomonadales bacterium]|nr:hypothetical protein [Pseudomonadales bacterium]